jgi:hypothetical protein
MTRPAGSLRLLTVARFPIVLLIHGTTRRIESDSSQAEDCECDRDLRAVVVRDGP